MTLVSPPFHALSEAIGLARQGLSCFPCGSNKQPLTLHGFKDATYDERELQSLWNAYPGSLVGVATGAISGFVVLDIDQRNGGASWFAHHRGELPPTRVHRTRSGGLHIMFRDQRGLRCSANRIAPGIDVRADGGYVIWWPAAGLPVLSDRQLAPWPLWLVPGSSRSIQPLFTRARVPDHLALRGLVRTVVVARAGERNNLTYWAACRAGEMVRSGLLDADLAAEVISQAATRAGLPYAEARRTTWSGLRTTGGVHHA